MDIRAADLRGLKEWRERLLTKGASAAGPLFKQSVADFVKVEKAGDRGEQRKFTFVISSGALDRDGDTVDPKGWDWAGYMAAGGPVLFAHKGDQPPVGKTERIFAAGGRVKAEHLSPPRGVYGFADTISDLVEFGALKATSVGFRPKDGTYKANEKGGLDFHGQELLEWSIVPIPSNPEALIEAKAAKIDLAPLKAWAERVLEEQEGTGLWLPKSAIETVLKIASGQRVRLALGGAGVPASGGAGGDANGVATHAGAGALTELKNAVLGYGPDSEQFDGPMTLGAALSEEEQKEEERKESYRIEDAFRRSLRSIVATAGAEEVAQLVLDACTEYAGLITPALSEAVAARVSAEGAEEEEEKAVVEVPWQKILAPKVEEREGKFVVIDSDGHTYGSHDTKEKAEAQLSALYAAKKDEKNYAFEKPKQGDMAAAEKDEEEEGAEDEAAVEGKKKPPKKPAPKSAKAGRVLSNANEAALRQARSMIDAILGQLPDPEDPANPDPAEGKTGPTTPGDPKTGAGTTTPGEPGSTSLVPTPPGTGGKEADVVVLKLAEEERVTISPAEIQKMVSERVAQERMKLTGKLPDAGAARA